MEHTNIAVTKEKATGKLKYADLIKLAVQQNKGVQLEQIPVKQLTFNNGVRGVT